MKSKDQPSKDRVESTQSPELPIEKKDDQSNSRKDASPAKLSELPLFIQLIVLAEREFEC